MDCLFWNIRGLNSKEKQLDVKKFLANTLAPIICLVETKVESLSSNKIVRNVLPHYKVLDPSSNGRIWILWNPNQTHLSLIRHSSQFIHCLASPSDGQPPFYISVIYGANDSSERQVLWEDLRSLSQQIGSTRWILGGDFNEVRFSQEKKGGQPAHTRRLAKFNKCIADCALQDLKSTGCHYSWSNNQVDRILCRLDRVLVNTSWMTSFPDSYVHYDSPGLSDHSPLKVTVLPSSSMGPKPFKYFKMWELHPEFWGVVENAWSVPFEGSPLFILAKKLQHLKMILKHWNNTVFGPINRSLEVRKAKLKEAQQAVMDDPRNPALLAAEKEAKTKYLDQLQMEESFHRQKSRLKPELQRIPYEWFKLLMVLSPRGRTTS
ncbi:hypothetical protein QJS04_geneDACA009440 [Acorus gramineus]|uniref:Endonuclease/exonuclease/phosphatase domain-containing protein n=1 Tax=Acorus gramineus TaxID=55184 RepID=A0AAV9AIS2_ACOGR|nr:hypothetical protein QJS04_geneDACA009440 [Acorus gramineus]